jgi:hypothetical protein
VLGLDLSLGLPPRRRNGRFEAQPADDFSAFASTRCDAAVKAVTVTMPRPGAFAIVAVEAPQDKPLENDEACTVDCDEHIGTQTCKAIASLPIEGGDGAQAELCPRLSTGCST